MSVRARAANLLWTAATIPAWQRYRAALRHPSRAQAMLLRRYLRQNRNTHVGRSLGFAGMERLADDKLTATYQSEVPLTRYDDLEPLIHRIREGQRNVLTVGAVRRLTPSSGSTAAAKLLPFTADLQREFNRAIDPWLAELFLRTPALLGGRAYWSISPAIPGDRTAAVPVAFADDSEYLGGARGALARTVLAVPDEVSRVTDPEAFRYITLLFLARTRDLRLISVWHPSFLLRLLDSLPDRIQQISDDIHTGTISARFRIPAGLRAALERRLRPDGARASELRRLSSLEPQAIWPELAVLSCWEDGASRSSAHQARARMPRVRLQPKGLVATEGIVTIPFQGLHPLAVRSHVFEFLDEQGRARLAPELHLGSEYSVVVTTGGGLYRYRLGDRVVVDGWVEQTPSLRFLGRDDRVSDRFGEKLSDGFVAGVLRRLFEGEAAPRFAMLAPEKDSAGFAYTLFMDCDCVAPDLAARLERALRQNPHYAWCVDLRQLNPARIARVGPHADRAYVDACVARGQRLGDVKPTALHGDTGWGAALMNA